MAGRPDCRVYSGPVLAVATHLKHVLDMNGIECEVRGEYLAAEVGEIPVIEAWPDPTLWLLDMPAKNESECPPHGAGLIGQRVLGSIEIVTSDDRLKPALSSCHTGTGFVGPNTYLTANVRNMAASSTVMTNNSSLGTTGAYLCWTRTMNSESATGAKLTTQRPV